MALQPISVGGEALLRRLEALPAANLEFIRAKMALPPAANVEIIPAKMPQLQQLIYRIQNHLWIFKHH